MTGVYKQDNHAGSLDKSLLIVYTIMQTMVIVPKYNFYLKISEGICVVSQRNNNDLLVMWTETRHAVSLGYGGFISKFYIFLGLPNKYP